jgi:hypothetical protein
MRSFSCLVIISAVLGPWVFAAAQETEYFKGYDVERTGLVPRYPADADCSPLTSLYASWDDVDGSRRTEAHSGVDVGRLGEPILSPAPGVIRAAWRADWGWGGEGALLIRHSKTELSLNQGADFYYSEFDHLRYDEIKSLAEGTKVVRGQKLATVFRPGGNQEYLPEVHWEVWELADDTLTTWHVNKFNGRYWTNPTAHLIDPLYMLSLHAVPSLDGSVDIQPYSAATDTASFRGFTYIVPCPAKNRSR